MFYTFDIFHNRVKKNILFLKYSSLKKISSPQKEPAL